MVATTSGVTTFTLDVDDIIVQSLKPLGGEHTSGIDLNDAKIVLNLVLIQMQNKAIPLNKLTFITQALTASVSTYALDPSVSDVLDCSISLNNTDLPIQRYGLRQYQDIPNKLQTQRPNLFTTQRGLNSVNVIFWPVPDVSTYTAKMLVAKRIEDINATYQKVDLPYRYLPLLIKWLSYELSLIRPSIPDTLRTRLKAEYEEYLPDTLAEDGERTDFTVRPGGISGRS